MKTSEILTAAKALIDTPGKWIQGCSARDEKGESVPCSSLGACKFCSIGALVRIAPDWEIEAQTVLYKEVRASERGQHMTSVAEFNDTCSHGEVMELWDKAIATAILEEKEGSDASV